MMFCRLTRLPLCSSKRVARSLSSGAEPLLLSERSASGVVTLTMNNPKRLNAWTKPMLLQIGQSVPPAIGKLIMLLAAPMSNRRAPGAYSSE